MGWTSAVVKKELKNLEWTQGPVGWRKSGVLVEFSDLAFHFTARYHNTCHNNWPVIVKLDSHWIIFRTGLDETRLDEILEELYTQVMIIPFPGQIELTLSYLRLTRGSGASCGAW